MREIKFRAWHKLNKEMEYNSPLFCECGNDELTGVTDYSIRQTWDYYEIMQFTGFKDISGKDIFEGDILKQEGLEVIVKWDEFIAGFAFEDWSGSQIEVTSGNSHMWEIIGNIYER